MMIKNKSIKSNKKSFWSKLKKTYIIIIIIPIICLGGFIILSSIRYVKDYKIQETNDIISLNLQDINNRMAQCETSINYLASNHSLQQFLLMDKSDPLTVSKQERNIGVLLYNVIFSNQYFRNLKIYTDKEFFALNDLMENNKGIKNKAWYKNTLEQDKPYWWIENNRIYIANRIVIPYPNQPVGIIRIEIKDEMFLDSMKVLKNIPISVTIVNKTDKIFQYGEENNDGYLTQKKDLEHTVWNIIYQVKRSYFFSEAHFFLLVPLFVISLVLMIVIMISRYITINLLHDMEILVSKVNEVEKGNLDVNIEGAETLEINILADSIRKMIKEIKMLIKKVYDSENEKKSLELDLLQSKLNPHFLYNNLSAINWLAINNGQDKIYEIITQLSMFYRTALNDGKKEDSLSIELENIKAYIRLQQISHENSFDVVYQIDKQLLDDYVPTFILQPLVENAVEHGIDSLREGRGLLGIKIYSVNDDLFLCVEDNGTALYEKIGESQLPAQRYGYGIQNVNRRIQLLMGDIYGITIAASSKGTKAIIKLKRNYYKS